MICDFCTQTFFRSDRREQDHHTSAQAFHDSYRQGCYICSTLAEDILTSSGVHQSGIDQAELSDLQAQWPLFVGSLASLSVATRGAQSWSLTFWRTVDLRREETDDDPEQTEDARKWIFNLSPLKKHRDEQEKSSDKGPSNDSTSSPHALRQVLNWMHECSANHEKCNNLNATRDVNRPSFLPTRVIDVGLFDFSEGDNIDVHKLEGGQVRLVQTDETMKGERYVTLSYSWGPQPWFRTTEATIERYKHGITFEEVPLTFKHVIVIARLLKIRFLWIDALCIIQAQASGEDWTREAPKMQDVYGHSYCNLAAVASATSHAGFFRDRNPAFTLPSAVDSKSKRLGRKTYLVVNQNLWEEELLSEPLYRRAWVFQERMLSRRILHFGHRQIFFECPSLQACETLAEGQLTALSERPAIDKEWKQALETDALTKANTTSNRIFSDLESFWKTAVVTYTSCSLTFGTDKIVAFHGIASLLKQAFGEKYYAGLWELAMVEQLSWHVVDGRQWNGKPSERQKPYRAPSWTWASVDGVIRAQHRIAPPRDYQAEISHNLPAEYKIDQKSMEANREWWCLHVTGRLARFKLRRSSSAETEWTLSATEAESAWVRAQFDVEQYLAQAGDAAATVELPVTQLAATTLKSEPDILFSNSAPLLETDCIALMLAYTKNPASFDVPGYSGHGILLKGVGTPGFNKPQKGRFERCGAFHFTSLDSSAWRYVESCYLDNTDGNLYETYDKQKGHTISLY